MAPHIFGTWQQQAENIVFGTRYHQVRFEQNTYLPFIGTRFDSALLGKHFRKSTFDFKRFHLEKS